MVRNPTTQKQLEILREASRLPKVFAAKGLERHQAVDIQNITFFLIHKLHEANNVNDKVTLSFIEQKAHALAKLVDCWDRVLERKRLLRGDGLPKPVKAKNDVSLRSATDTSATLVERPVLDVAVSTVVPPSTDSLPVTEPS